MVNVRAASINITKTTFPETYQIAGIATSASGQYVIVPQDQQTRNYGKGYIYHSSDYGATFSKVPSNYPQPYYSLSMTLDGKRAVTTASIQYISTNFGTTWTAASLAKEDPNVMRIDSKTGQNMGLLYMGDSPCLLLSKDYGMTFSQLLGPDVNTSFCETFAMSDDLQTIVVRVDEVGLFTTHDQGKSWSITYPLTEDMDFAATLVYNPYTGHFWGSQYVVIPEDGIAYVEIGLVKSTDHGDSWQEVRTRIRAHEGQFAVSADEQTILMGTSGEGVYISLDGGVSFSQLEGVIDGGYFVAMNAQGTEFYYWGQDDFLYKGIVMKNNEGK
ncbi:hypothetical protein EON65_42375 [archaeon]|nr:MAG: hypothetical protein EON65_42375 [archaeon]